MVCVEAMLTHTNEPRAPHTPQSCSAKKCKKKREKLNNLKISVCV